MVLQYASSTWKEVEKLVFTANFGVIWRTIDFSENFILYKSIASEFRGIAILPEFILKIHYRIRFSINCGNNVERNIIFFWFQRFIKYLSEKTMQRIVAKRKLHFLSHRIGTWRWCANVEGRRESRKIVAAKISRLIIYEFEWSKKSIFQTRVKIKIDFSDSIWIENRFFRCEAKFDFRDSFRLDSSRKSVFQTRVKSKIDFSDSSKNRLIWNDNPLFKFVK